MQAAPDMSADIRWRFGAFVVWETQRRLERFGQAIRLGSRAFELLLQLIARAGEVVSSEELLAAVWSGVVVEEASVRVQMSALRKALGEPEPSDPCEEWISNIPLRGYRFNARALREEVGAASGSDADEPAFAKPPVPLTRLIGREADVERMLAALDTHRIVTVAGTGGIGKTRAALHAAQCLQQRRAVATAFVDLAPLVSQEHVLGTMARALGAPADAPDTLQAIEQRLAGRELLLLVDNCEHVLDALVPLLAGLLAALPRLRVLATSREALRAEGECVLRLPTLAVPDTEQLNLAQALQSPAVELLVERALAAGARAPLEADGALLARIARQIDGIPLAIELVAARLGVQPIGDLARRLNDHMRLYSAGNGSVLPRHRTLAAALDWSIALLDNAELQLFRRLSVFRGRFDVESALGMAAADMEADLAFDALISLANKSLVAFDNNEPFAPYRLLDTTRSYAAGQLADAGEAASLRRCHALFMRDLMRAATAELRELTVREWSERYAHRLDDVRSALDACLAPLGDAQIAATLAIESAPLWFHASQIEEYRDRVRATLEAVERMPGADPETATWLHVALGNALFHTLGPTADMGAACERALADALAARSCVLELQARWGLCMWHVGRGDYAPALRHAARVGEIAQASRDPVALNLSHRIAALAHHFHGDFALARENVEAAMRVGSAGLARNARDNVFQIDAPVATNAMLARTLWIQGDAARALRTAASAVAHAGASGNALSLCFALFGACPVALWAGRFGLARKWIRMMLEETQRRGLVFWHRWAQCYSLGLEAATADDREARVRDVAARLADFDPMRREMLVSLCPEWLDEDTLERARRGGSWSAAEAWRAAAWRSERQDRHEEAQAFCRTAIETARAQGALAWELRATLQLARLRDRLGRTAPALVLLEDICERASGSHGNPCLARARALRDRLVAR